MVAHKGHAANSKVANAIMTKIFCDIFAVDPVIDINFSRLFLYLLSFVHLINTSVSRGGLLMGNQVN